MAQVMQTDRRDLGSLDGEPEPAADVGGVDRCAVLAGEHVPGVVPHLPDGEPPLTLLSLAATVLAAPGLGLIASQGPADHSGASDLLNG
ncbi:hypothetical protein GCM10010170_093650 [Dactylosporangium salmoneum]|uniref:Uncharacterized protein n=1 Tax=Dactylosporangium salmoneum TaxID=53361 RepID=A0ABN3HNU3_9ACTN